MADVTRDGNHVPGLIGTSNADGVTPVPIYADPITRRLLVNSTGGGSSGTTTVDGTVAISGTVNVAIVSGTVAVGTVTIGGISGTVAVSQGTVTVTNFPAVQPVSGTVAVAQGTVVITNTAFGATQSTSPWVVSGTVAVAQGTVVVSTLPAIPSGSNTIGTVSITSFASSAVIGTVSVNSLPAITGTVSVSQGTVVINTGSNAIGTVQVSVLPALTTGSNTVGTVTVRGANASGASIAANPVTIGARAATANPTAVADGQVVNGMKDKLGRTIVVPGHIRDLVTFGTVTITGTAETTILAAGAAGVFHDITSIKFANTSATAVRVDLREATGSNVVDCFYVPAGDMRGAVYTTPYKQNFAANNWTAQVSAAVTDVRISIQAVKNI